MQRKYIWSELNQAANGSAYYQILALIKKSISQHFFIPMADIGVKHSPIINNMSFLTEGDNNDLDRFSQTPASNLCLYLLH